MSDNNFPDSPRIGDAHVIDGDVYMYGGNGWTNVSSPRFMMSEDTLFNEAELEILREKYIGKDITVELLCSLLNDFTCVTLAKSGKHTVIYRAF